MSKARIGFGVVMVLCIFAGRVGGGVPQNLAPPNLANQKKYEPTIESLNTHPLPDWYADAKLGIFIHWGLYSVPGWAVLTPEAELEKLPVKEYVKRNPYAEWYYNTMRLHGSPTQEYHKEHYGADYNYYNFAAAFDKDIQRWHPDEMAKVFKMAGARYVVLTSKHHEGFTLWPSVTANPTLPKDQQHASRDIVGELTTAVRGQGMKMGLYYSGGYDWTFVPGPITDWQQAKSVQPQSEAYGKYADAHMRELLAKYKPSVLWNDIDYPKSGHPLEIMAEYYNAIPDGVVDDRFGVKHSDFVSPEYETLSKIQTKKWEECRGLGRSFGFNRAEGEKGNDCERCADSFAGGHREQEREFAAGCGAGSGRNDTRGADGSSEGVGCVAGRKWRGDLWHAAVEARGRRDGGGVKGADYAKGWGGVCVFVGRAKGENGDDSGFEVEGWSSGDGAGREWEVAVEAGGSGCGGVVA